MAQVESGRIDMAHHHNYAKLALRELSELEEAILTALQLVKLEETLVIVTADHSHAFTINGYPKRGNDILGFANDPSKPNVPAYETLSYINGPGFFHHRRNDSNNVNETWRPVDLDQTRDDPYYTQMAGIYLEDETHGGEDVGVYAIGNELLSSLLFFFLIYIRYIQRYGIITSIYSRINFHAFVVRTHQKGILASVIHSYIYSNLFYSKRYIRSITFRFFPRSVFPLDSRYF